jgi:hypothetical protein
MDQDRARPELCKAHCAFINSNTTFESTPTNLKVKGLSGLLFVAKGIFSLSLATARDFILITLYEFFQEWRPIKVRTGV